MRFDAQTLANRRVNKSAIETGFGLTLRSDGPLFTVISRLTWRGRGMDVFPLADRSSTRCYRWGVGWL